MQQGIFDNKPPEEKFKDVDGVELSLREIRERARVTLEHMSRSELYDIIELYLTPYEYADFAKDNYGRWYPSE